MHSVWQRTRAWSVEEACCYLELLALKDLQACHGNLEGFPVIILQEVLYTTAHKVEALGPSRFQRPESECKVLHPSRLVDMLGPKFPPNLLEYAAIEPQGVA